MFRFENPLDPSKDGGNPFIDGVRFHIRNSVSIKEELLPHIDYYVAIANDDDSATDILDRMLASHNYDADELTIADEHELLDKIQAQISWIG